MVRHGDHGVNESVAAMTRPRHEQEVSVSASWPQQYPGLFDPHPASWDGTERDYLLQFTLDLPSDNLVVNVRLVAVGSQGLVVCRAAEGWRFLPGGSREQAESLEETATRELMEEAGCVLTGPVSWFGSFSVTNPPGSQPWRPWHPWPVTSWLVGVASSRWCDHPPTRTMARWLSRYWNLNRAKRSTTCRNSTTADKQTWSAWQSTWDSSRSGRSFPVRPAGPEFLDPPPHLLSVRTQVLFAAADFDNSTYRSRLA